MLKLIIFGLALVLFNNVASNDYETESADCTEDGNDYDGLFDGRPTKIQFNVSEPWESPDSCVLNHKCVPFYLCTEDGTLKTDGSFMIDERMDNEGEMPDFGCPQMQVCCKKETFVKEIPLTNEICWDQTMTTTPPTTTTKREEKPKPTTTTTRRTTIAPRPTTKRPEFVVPVSFDFKRACELKSVIKTTKKCGFHNERGIGGIVSSYQNKSRYASFGEFPWTAAILKQVPVDTDGSSEDDSAEQKFESKYVAVGSLIHEKIVLTTAHVVSGIRISDLTVRLGEWNTQSTNEPCGDENVKVSKIVRHKGYRPGRSEDNIALLILAKTVKLKAHINTICLPEKGAKFEFNRCLAAGWGQDKFGKAGLYQNYLKKVELPVIPNSNCQEFLRKTKLGAKYTVPQGLICAGGEKDRDLCSGDGGAPLMCESDNDPKRVFQVGSMYAGVECGKIMVPALYTEISHFRDWIDAEFKKLGLSTSSYTY